MLSHRPRAATAIAVIAVAALFAGGCKGRNAETSPTAGPSATASPTPSATPTAGPTGSATPTASPTDPATVFAADGIGPYVISTSLSDLQSRALVQSIVENVHCATYQGAEATGRYAGQLTLTFRLGRLVTLHTESTVLVTPSGARVGMTLSQLRGVYGTRGTLITGTLGNKAYLVRVPASGLAIAFFMDSAGTTVRSMSGGEAQSLEDAARTGEGC